VDEPAYFVLNRCFQWDLGEFDQKGSISTRWGTKEEFLECIRTAKESGIDILLDAVLNVSLPF
jgi:alpha-amylase